MPLSIRTAALLLVVASLASAAEQQDPSAAAYQLSIVQPPDAPAYEGSPIPLAWTLTHTTASATAISVDRIACEIDFDNLEVRFHELAVDGQAPIAFRAWVGAAIMSGPRRAEPPLLPGASFRHTLILNRYCSSIPPGTHRISWSQPVLGISAGPVGRHVIKFSGSLTIQVQPGPHPRARDLAAELYRTYQSDADMRVRCAAVRQLSYLLSPVTTPYAELILQGGDAVGQVAVADFLDRVRGDGDVEANALLTSIYLEHHPIALEAALRNLDRRQELVDAAILHAMLTQGDPEQRSCALTHIAQVASAKTVAERRALVASKAVPLDDLLALMASPSENLRSQALAALTCFEVVVPLAR